VNLLNRNISTASSIADSTERAIHTPFNSEKLIATDGIRIPFGDFNEPWEVFILEGDNYSGVRAGRILLGYQDEPAGGIKWFEEDGRPVITHYFLDEDLRGKKVISQLLEIYKKYVSDRIIITGPFSEQGKAVADKKADEIVDYKY